MNENIKNTSNQKKGIDTDFNIRSSAVPFFVTINKDYSVLVSHSGQWTPPKGTLTVQVYSLTRSLLLEQDIAIDGTQPQTIEVSSLPADQYYIAVSAKDFPGGYIEAPRVKLAFVNRNGTDIEFEISNHERKLNIEEIGTDTPTPHHPTLSHRPTTDHNLTPQYDDDLTIDELISRDIELPEEELLSFDIQEDEDTPIRENKIKKDEKRNKKDYRRERIQKQKEQEILERNFVLKQERAEGGDERKGERVGGDSVYDPYNYTSETYDYPHEQDEHTEERTEQYRSVVQTQDKTHEPTVSEKETVQTGHSDYTEPLTHTDEDAYKSKADSYKPSERPSEPEIEHYNHRESTEYTEEQASYNTHKEQPEGHYSDYLATSYGESEAIYNEIYKTEEVSVEKPVEPTKANINEHEDKPADTYRDIYDRSFKEQGSGADTPYGLDDKNIYEEDLNSVYGDTQYEDTDKSYATPHYNEPKVQNSEIYDEPSVPTYKEEQTPVHSSETYERQGDDLYSTENATHEAEERPRDERQVSASHGENQFPIQQSEEYTPKTAPYREDQPPVHQPEQYRSGATSSDVNKSTNEHIFPPQDQPRQADVSHKPEGYVSEYRDPDSYTSSYVAREQEYRPASTPHESKTETERDAPFSFRPTDTQATETNRENVGWKTRQEEIDLRRYVEGERAKARTEGGGERVPTEYSEDGLMDVLRGTMSGYTEDIALTKEDDASVITIKHNEGNDTTRIELRENQNTVVYTTNTIAGPAIAKTVESKINAFESPYKDASTIYREAETGRVFERHIVEPEAPPTVEEATNRISVPEWSDEELKSRLSTNYSLSDISIIAKGDQKVIKIVGDNHDDIVYSFNAKSRRPEQYNMSEQEKEIFNVVTQYDNDLQAKISAVRLLNTVKEASEREATYIDASYSSLFFGKDDYISVRKLGNGALIPDAETKIFDQSKSFITTDYLSTFRSINIYRDEVGADAAQVLKSAILSGRSLDSPVLVNAETEKDAYDEAVLFHRNATEQNFDTVQKPLDLGYNRGEMFGLERAIEISNKFSSPAKTMIKNSIVNETEAGQGGREIWTRISVPTLFAAAYGEKIVLKDKTASILRESLKGSRIERAFIADIKNSGITGVDADAIDLGNIKFINEYKRQVTRYARDVQIRGIANMNSYEISENIKLLQIERLNLEDAAKKELIDKQIATLSAYNILSSIDNLSKEEFARIMSEAGLLRSGSVGFSLSTIEGVRQYERLISEYCRVSGLPDFTKMDLEDLMKELKVLSGDHRVVCEQAMSLKGISGDLKDLSRMNFMARHSLITTVQRLFGNLDLTQGTLMVYRSVNSVIGILKTGSKIMSLTGRIGMRSLKFLHLDDMARKMANKTGISRVRAFNKRQKLKKAAKRTKKIARKINRRQIRVDRLKGRVANIQNKPLRRVVTSLGKNVQGAYREVAKLIQGVYKGATKGIMFAGKVVAGVILVGILAHLLGATLESLTTFMPDFIEDRENRLYSNTYNKLIEIDDNWVAGLRADSSKSVKDVLKQDYIAGFYMPNRKGDGLEQYKIKNFGIKDAANGEAEFNKAGYILNFFERGNIPGLSDEERIEQLEKARQISVISNAKQIVSCADIYTDFQGLLYEQHGKHFTGYSYNNKNSLWAATHRMTYTSTPVYACEGFCEVYEGFKCNDAKMHNTVTQAATSNMFRCPTGSIPTYSSSGCKVHTELSSKTETHKFYCGYSHLNEKTGEIHACTGHEYEVKRLKDCDEQVFDISKGTTAYATVYEGVPVDTLFTHWDDGVMVPVEDENDNGLDDPFYGPYVKAFLSKCNNPGIFKMEWGDGFLVMHYCKGHPNSIYSCYKFEDEINIAGDGEEPLMLPVSSYARKVLRSVSYRKGAYVCQGYCPGHDIPYCKGHTNLQIDAFITLSMDASIPMGTENKTNVYTVFQADIDGGTGKRLVEPYVPPLPMPGAPPPETPTPEQLFSWYPWNTYEAESLDLRLVAQRRFDEDWYSLYGLKTYNEAGIILPQKEVSSLLLMAQNNKIEDKFVEYTWGTEKQKSDRLKVVSYALNSVGKVPYFFGGYAVKPGYDDANGFGQVTTYPDHMGRTLKGMDCARWARWVYKSAGITLKTGLRLDYNGGAEAPGASICFGRGSFNTKLIRNGYSGGKQVYISAISPGDILYTETNDHVAIFLSWIDDKNMLVIEEVAGSTENVRVGVYESRFWEYAYSWIN